MKNSKGTETARIVTNAQYIAALSEREREREREREF